LAGVYIETVYFWFGGASTGSWAVDSRENMEITGALSIFTHWSAAFLGKSPFAEKKWKRSLAEF
jgi:hypothetical protein